MIFTSLKVDYQLCTLITETDSTRCHKNKAISIIKSNWARIIAVIFGSLKLIFKLIFKSKVVNF